MAALHLEKVSGYLPGIPDAIPAIFGLARQEYDDLLARFAGQADAAAAELLTESVFAAHVDTLRFEAGQTVLVVGDSITDDLLSWAEILRHVLRRRRPEADLRWVNSGLSAHTSTMVLRRWKSMVAPTRPDWVLCQLGGNDVTRVGPDAQRPQVAVADTVANL